MVKRRYRFTKTAKIAIVQLAICAIGLLSGFIWEIDNQNQQWDKLVYPGIKVADINLSGKTREEGIAIIISDYIGPLFQNGINVIVNGKTYIMDCSRLILGYNIENAVDKAIAAGKSLGFFSKFQIIKQGISNRYNIDYIYDDNYIKEFINLIEKDINIEPINASVTVIPEGNVKIVDDVKGYKLKIKEFEKNLKENIESGVADDIILEAPIDEISALITADKLYPINKKLASFTTSFASSSVPRAHNIELATKAINGSIIMPGDIFSFNDCVGERTKNRGYMAAPVLEEGNYKPGVGGGVCQVSTTLYKIALDSGFRIIERRSHSLPPPYIELGLDATVSWGNTDLKFENNLEYPIFIEAYAKEEKLYINMYSNSCLLNRTYSIKNDVYTKVRAKTRIIEAPDLREGETVVVNKGIDGYKVRVTRETYEKGKLINTEAISNDYYKPVNKVIRKGIKAES